jgi:hypothetical protein
LAGHAGGSVHHPQELFETIVEMAQAVEIER